MHFAVKTHCNMQSKRSVICSKTQDTRLGLNLLYTFFGCCCWIGLQIFTCLLNSLTPPRNALTRYKMQAKQEVHMFTERKHLRLYKETRILIQRNHALTQRNAHGNNQIFCTKTQQLTGLHNETHALVRRKTHPYTKKYHALIQRSTCTDAKSWDVCIEKHANTSTPIGCCPLINYFRLFPSFPVHLSFACRHFANLILLTQQATPSKIRQAICSTIHKICTGAT